MKSTSNVLSVSEGKTMVNLIPGIFIMVAALAFIGFYPFVTIALVIVAILLFLAETGLEIDLEKMTYRKYQENLGSKSGLWKKLPEIKEFHLRLSVESKTIRGMMMPVRSWNHTTHTSKSITYDLLYQDPLGEYVIIYEFQDYGIAKTMLKQLRATEKFEVVDHIAIKLQENRAKRANRR